MSIIMRLLTDLAAKDASNTFLIPSFSLFISPAHISSPASVISGAQQGLLLFEVHFPPTLSDDSGRTDESKKTTLWEAKTREKFCVASFTSSLRRIKKKRNYSSTAGENAKSFKSFCYTFMFVSWYSVNHAKKIWHNKNEQTNARHIQIERRHAAHALLLLFFPATGTVSIRDDEALQKREGAFKLLWCSDWCFFSVRPASHGAGVLLSDRNLISLK